jgi:hypothetical protein
MLLGIFRPDIILPDVDYSDEQLHAIFSHELIHLRRKDTLVKWLALIATCLHWFNPIVWFVRREINRNCELACDEAVIRHLDLDRKHSYGNVLLDVSANFTAPKAIAATMMCEEKKNLKERIDSIMKSKKHTRIAIALSLVLVISAVCLVLVLGSGSDDDRNTSPDLLANGYVFEDHRFGIKLILPAEFEGRYRIMDAWAYEPDATSQPDLLAFAHLGDVLPHLRFGASPTPSLTANPISEPMQILGSARGTLFSIYRFSTMTEHNLEDFGTLLFETDEFYFVFVEPRHIDRYSNVDLTDPATIAYLELVINNDDVHNKLRAYPLPITESPFGGTYFITYRTIPAYLIKELAEVMSTGQFTHPLPDGRLTAEFGERLGRFHNGVDWAAPRGTAVGAADGGVVTFADDRGSMGNLIIITHVGGIETYYAHLDEIHVSIGDQVYQGQHIGDVGDTGRVTGPALHFELHIDGVPQNPMNFL